MREELIEPLSSNRVAEIGEIVCGVHDADERERGAALEGISRMSIPDFRLLLRAFDFDGPRPAPPVGRKIVFYVVLGCLVVAAVLYVALLRAGIVPLPPANAALWMCWTLMALQFAACSCGLLLRWCSLWQGPRRRTRIFGRESKAWPADRRELSKTLAKLSDTRFLPAILDAALWSYAGRGVRYGELRAGALAELTAPVKHLVSLLSASDIDLAPPATRRLFYLRLQQLPPLRYWELMVTVFQAAERMRDSEALSLAQRWMHMDMHLEPCRRIQQAAMTYLAALDQPLGSVGSSRSITLVEHGAPKVRCADVLRMIAPIGAFFIVMIAIDLVLIFFTRPQRRISASPPAGAAQPMGVVAR